MRAFLKPFRRPISVPQQLRTLTTRPRPIPKHSTTWNPSAQTQEGDGEAETRDSVAGEVHSFAALKARRDDDRAREGLTVDRDIGRQYATRRLEQVISFYDQNNEPGGKSDELRPRLWRAYALAKSHAPDLLQTLPRRTWRILWRSQAIKLRLNRYSRAHLVELYKDMVATGISPSTSQKAAYLESMFLNGMEQQALKEWEELFAQSTSESEMHFQRGLAETGARMHALAGNLDRAKMIAEKIFDHLPSWDPEVIMVVFRAHTRSKAALHHEQAWDLYLRMKTLLGENFQAIAYNNCFIGFLEARNLQYARQVLGDMVKAGVLANGDSEEHVLEVRRKLHLLNRLTTDIVQATSVALYALTTLPRAYHVHVFADWIKLAAAKKAPEAAAQILDMMFRRGHQPDTVNFNYFLRSLFSTKQKSHELRAENIAWHMVDMASRAASGNGRRQPRTSVSDPLLLRKIPPANGATYALLIRHHANHSQWEHTDYLIRHMRARQIPQNTETMNVSMDSLCRQGDYNKVWDTYSTLTNPPKEQPGVFPNGATFRCLWKTLRLALGDVEHREHSTLPGPRELLAENIRWWNMVRSRYDASRFRAGLAAEDSGALSKLVMHCFSYKKDLPGSLVAMHALRSQFYILPSMEASWILQNQIAWVEASREAKTARARYRMSGLHQRNLKQVGRVQNILFHDRLARMNMSEEEFASLNDERKADITLDSLSEFIRAVLKRQHAPEDVEAMIDKAKNDIGMPNLPTGDMDAFIVA